MNRIPVIYNQAMVTINWSIRRDKVVPEPFSDTLKVYLVTDVDRRPVDYRIIDNKIQVLLTGDMMPGVVYGLAAVWTRKERVLRSVAEKVFCVTDIIEEVTTPHLDDAMLHVKTIVNSIGVDGLSAYEMAVLHGKTSLSEQEWVSDLSKLNEVFVETVNNLNKLAAFKVNITTRGKHGADFDKSYEEIQEAHKSGKLIEFLINGDQCAHSFVIGAQIVVYTFIDCVENSYTLTSGNEGIHSTNTLVSDDDTDFLEDNLKTINGQSIVGEGDIVISGGKNQNQFADAMLQYTLEDGEADAKANCNGLLLYSPSATATRHLGIQHTEKIIKQFAYKAAEQLETVPEEGEFYLCIVKQVDNGDWKVVGCSSNAVNIRAVSVGSYIEWNFDDVTLSARESVVGVAVMLSLSKRVAGDVAGAISSWPTMRPSLKIGRTAENNACICLTGGDWQSEWQAAYKITLAEKLPELTGSDDAARGLMYSTNGVLSWTKVATSRDVNGKQDKLVSGETIKEINGQSLLGHGNLDLNPFVEVILDWSEDREKRVANYSSGDILDMFNKGKIVILRDYTGDGTNSPEIYQLESVKAEKAIFVSHANGEGNTLFVYRIIVDNNRQTSGGAIYIDSNSLKTSNMTIEAMSDGSLTYPTTKAVNTKIAKKQDKLVSGVNIATINGHNLLEETDIWIEGGGANVRPEYPEGSLIDVNSLLAIKGYKIKTVTGDYIKNDIGQTQYGTGNYQFMSKTGDPDSYVFSVDSEGMLTNIKTGEKFSVFGYDTNGSGAWIPATLRYIEGKGYLLVARMWNGVEYVNLVKLDGSGLDADWQLDPGEAENFPIDTEKCTPYFEMEPVYGEVSANVKYILQGTTEADVNRKLQSLQAEIESLKEALRLNTESDIQNAAADATAHAQAAQAASKVADTATEEDVNSIFNKE